LARTQLLPRQRFGGPRGRNDTTGLREQAVPRLKLDYPRGTSEVRMAKANDEGEPALYGHEVDG